MKDVYRNSDDRWAIYLDIEGTSAIYKEQEGRFYCAFDRLLKAICDIGSKVFSETPARLFVHQTGGDGLLVVSEFAEASSERAISIAVVLLQVLLVNGLVGKAGISQGTFADVKSCFPSLGSVPTTSTGHRIGSGLLTTFPVMGTALVNAHRIATCAPHGCRLAVEPALLPVTCPQGVVLSDSPNPIVVDWIHSRTTTTNLIAEKTGLDLPPSNELEKRLVEYVNNTPVADSDWGRNSLLLNGC